MTAVLLSNFVWEGLSSEMAGVVALDGHIYKQLDTGESYIRRSGSWQFVNLGLSFIKATKSGQALTDVNGYCHVSFATPFSNSDYSASFSSPDNGDGAGKTVSCFYSNIAVDGFDVNSRDSKGVRVGNIQFSWLVTRNYNPYEDNMTVTISAITAGKRTLIWTETSASQIILDFGEDAVHYYWNIGYGRHGTEEAPVTWAQITAAEKLAIMNTLLRRAVLDAARSYNTVNSVGGIEAVRAAKELENETKYKFE